MTRSKCSPLYRWHPRQRNRHPCWCRHCSSCKPDHRHADRAILTLSVSGTVANHVEILDGIAVILLADISLGNHQHIVSRTGNDGIAGTKLRSDRVAGSVTELRQGYTTVVWIDGIVITRVSSIVLGCIPLEWLAGIVAYKGMLWADLAISSIRNPLT